MVELSTFLKWDSSFFSKQIAQINGCNIDDKSIIAEINSLFQKGIDCIYLNIDRTINLSEFDSILVDKKRTYIHNDPCYEYLNFSDHISIQSPKFRGQSSDLYTLGIQSGEHSRFKIDPHFSKEDFESLYKKWVDNSLNEEFADYVITAIDSSPIGFVTAKINRDRIKIGLIATDKLYRGKGIGTLLMQEIQNEASKKSLKVEVVTQADNYPACRFYEKSGFTISDEIVVYHIWNSQGCKSIR